MKIPTKQVLKNPHAFFNACIFKHAFVKGQRVLAVVLLLSVGLMTYATSYENSVSNLKPSSCQSFWYEDGEWKISTSQSIKYDTAGNPIQVDETDYDDNSQSRHKYEYNSDGMITYEEGLSKDESGEWKPFWLYRLQYDTVVKDWRIYTYQNNLNYDSESEWRIDVTRDEKGRITNAKRYWHFHDEAESLQYTLDVEYDDVTGYANKIEETYFTDSNPNKKRVWSNLEWNNTNGQIVTNALGATGGTYGCFLIGENRLVKADITEDGQLIYSMNVEYANEKDYSASFMLDNTLVMFDEIVYTDTYGSNRHTEFENGKWSEEIVEYDSHGNRTSDLEKEGTDRDNMETDYVRIWEHEYDPATSCLLQTIEKKPDGKGAYEPTEKVAYSDFVDVSMSSVNEISVDSRNDYRIYVKDMTIISDTDFPMSVYTIDGKLVDSDTTGFVKVPSKGIYIVRIGGKGYKVNI